MSTLQILCLIISLLTLIVSIKNTNFKSILSTKLQQHVLFGFSTLVFVLWLFRVSIYDGLIIHFLALTTLTLVLGFRWAIISMFVLLFVYTLIGYEQWQMFGVNALLGGVLPITVSYAIYAFTFHNLPRQPFIYIFLCAFFPGGLSIAVKMMSLSAYYWLDSQMTWQIIYHNYAQMTVLMMFPEAFFNGFLITALVMYKPDLVYTYNDKFYLNGK